MADNDLSLGMVVERIAHSRTAGSTLVFVIEDDAQNGADHVDARRSIALVVGPYVRQGALISTRYTAVNVLRTIEAVLGLRPLGLNDGLASSMDMFDQAQAKWTFHARAADVLRTMQLTLDVPEVPVLLGSIGDNRGGLNAGQVNFSFGRAVAAKIVLTPISDDKGGRKLTAGFTRRRPVQLSA